MSKNNKRNRNKGGSSVHRTVDPIRSIDDRMAALEIERMQYLEKAMRDGSPLQVLRANDELAKLRKTTDQKSYTFDPYTLYNSLGFKDRPTNMSYDYLRAMARTPIVRAAIDTRQNQIGNFSRPTLDADTVGWTIRKKRSLFDEDGDDLTDQEKREVEGIVNFLQNCGVEKEDYSRFTRTTFEQFLREGTRDTLTLDQLCFELVPNRRDNLDHFVTVDAATFRYADEQSYYDGKGEVMEGAMKNGQLPMYVQLYNRKTVADFYSWELGWGIRNKSTDIRNNGYGVSELEDLVKIITWMLFGDSYNGKFFSQGAAPKGILKVMGNVNNDRLNEFKMYWQQMVTGVMNAWRTPVLEADKVEWIDLQKSNQDMQFGKWQEYLIRIVCAVFKIDPAEMGFIMDGAGGKDGAYVSHKQRTDYSKDKGLIPLLRFWEEMINKYLVGRVTRKYEFAFTGISPEDEESATNNDVKKVTNWMTVNEVRAKRKLPPLPGGDIVLNSVYAQMQMQNAMGSQESNDWVDEETGDSSGNMYKENPFDTDEDMNKSVFDELNEWIEKGMPNTLKLI